MATNDFYLRRKLTFKSHGKQIVLIKKPVERSEHVWMKALVWALYLPDYPSATVEVGIGDKYKPDVVALDENGRPVFWAECGKVTSDKIASTTRRYRDTHFVFARWNERADLMMERVRKNLAPSGRRAPVDVLIFPQDSAARFIGEDGYLFINFSDISFTRLQ